MSLIAVIIGAVGGILGVLKSRWCFILWLPCNIYWVWFNWPTVQSWVFAIMSVSCVAGWIAWSGDKKRWEMSRQKLLAEIHGLIRQADGGLMRERKEMR